MNIENVTEIGYFPNVQQEIIITTNRESDSLRIYGKPLINTGLIFLTDKQRLIFFIAYLILFIFAIVANLVTIYVIIKRKNRWMQKTCIISLALSDIVVALFFGVNNMVMFSHPMVNWTLGDFMCYFVPYMETVGSISNSITLTVIALDRYKNIVHPLNKQWDPNKWICSLIFLTIWGCAIAISYPTFTFYTPVDVLILIINPNNPTTATGEIQSTICLTFKKGYNMIFFSIILSILFIPLMCIFLWLYYKIAQLIWRRRKPITVRIENNLTSTGSETSSTDLKTSHVKATPVVSQVNKRMKYLTKGNKLHMERKIRTFKIILVTMLVFFVCRVPHWTFMMIRLSMNKNKPIDWITSFTLSGLLIVNTIINPFLYTFLNQTIFYVGKIISAIADFISKICCCCCSTTEFDDYEIDNPFAQNMGDPRPSQTSSIIPRGPYIDNVNTHKPNNVKFDDINVINLYLRDENLRNTNCNTY